MADDKKIIFSMVGVSKIIPPQRQILKNIYLSFFYGAKIGIIGLNGSGKSTLLKIIAGLDKRATWFSLPATVWDILSRNRNLIRRKQLKRLCRKVFSP